MVVVQVKDRNPIPRTVWAYSRDGHQGLEKWLSCREAAVSGRGSTGEEAPFAKIARRIAEILHMGPALDAAYAKARGCAVPWPAAWVG